MNKKSMILPLLLCTAFPLKVAMAMNDVLDTSPGATNPLHSNLKNSSSNTEDDAKNTSDASLDSSLQAAEGNTEVTIDDVLKSTEIKDLSPVIPNDPSENALYGGLKGNKYFQEQALNHAYFLANEISLRQGFTTLHTKAAKFRHDIAVKTDTPGAKDFNIMRTPESVPWAGGATTPVLKYPFMRKTLIEHVLKLNETENFTSLDDKLEYRYRTRTLPEWVALAEKEHNEKNQLKVYLERMFTGKRGPNENDGCMWLFDQEKDWIDKDGVKTFAPDQTTLQRYLRFMSIAYTFITDKNNPIDITQTTGDLKADIEKRSGLKIEDFNIPFSHIEIKFKGVDIYTRGIMFPRDANSKPDLSDVPFALLHPPSNSVEYHLGKCHEAFESARHCNGDVATKIRKILEFSYIWSLTMPYVRGSAADNEFLTNALFIHHSLGLVKSNILNKVDECAQGSFNSEQFFNKLESLGISNLDPLPYTMDAFSQRLSGEKKVKEYPDQVFGVSAKPGMYVLDVLVTLLGAPESTYSSILNYVTNYGKEVIKATYATDVGFQTQKQNVSFVELVKCENAFNEARIYQENDNVTLAKIKTYIGLYTKTDPYVFGTDIVNNLLFQALCLHHNIMPQLIDSTSLIQPLTISEPLKRSLFKGRYVVASSQEIVDKISGYLNESFDPVNRDTPLCEIMKTQGSDKSTVHNYTKMYDFLLAEKREDVKNVFEMGIGSIDPNFSYTMGPNGTVGASLRGWRDYFSNAHIYGADIDAKALIQEDRITTHYADQLDSKVINAMFAKIPVKQFDVIIDDGLHCYQANEIFFLEAIKRLAKGGTYIIEDIAPRGVPLVLQLLEEVNLPAAFIKLPVSPARFDNNIFVVFNDDDNTNNDTSNINNDSNDTNNDSGTNV